MFNKKSTAGLILVVLFLFLCQSFSYAQPGSVRDTTTYELISPSYCCPGSVPDTGYIAEIISDNIPSRKKTQITFYRFYCRTCCFILPSGKQKLPEKDKVTNPALIKKLQAALKKQLEHNLKVVNSIKY
ncbi:MULTISPECIES: hypothetical protein [Niastella]|uniref:Uncharacterized protein n=1 Tax=Niastella soli TaxID=2821487 RepID=A0ABS3YW18_9BACT|nr:hypothetical protein [Niastella soli]MBO9202124.1 hypothetical protein [Niastella soli]